MKCRSNQDDLILIVGTNMSLLLILQILMRSGHPLGSSVLSRHPSIRVANEIIRIDQVRGSRILLPSPKPKPSVETPWRELIGRRTRNLTIDTAGQPAWNRDAIGHSATAWIIRRKKCASSSLVKLACEKRSLHLICPGRMDDDVVKKEESSEEWNELAGKRVM